MPNDETSLSGNRASGTEPEHDCARAGKWAEIVHGGTLASAATLMCRICGRYVTPQDRTRTSPI